MVCPSFLDPFFLSVHIYSYSLQEQVPGTLETMSIDSENAQDFTKMYSFTQPFEKLGMPLSVIPEDSFFGEPMASGLHTDLRPASSAEGSPDSLMQTIQLDDQDFGDFSVGLDVSPFEDVSQIFNWEAACASLVNDDTYDEYKSSFTSPPVYGSYLNAMSFPSIQTLPSAPEAPSVVHSRSNSIVKQSDCSVSSPVIGSEDYQEATSPDGSTEEEISDGPVTTCHNCGVTKTPLWRRTPDKRHSLCNACGLYLKQYKTMRPLGPRSRSQPIRKDEENMACANCEATKTSLWRKDENGQVICNACGLYHKLHGKARPITMRKEKISRRKRYRNLAPNTPEPRPSTTLPDVLPLSVSPTLSVHDTFYASPRSSPLTGAIVA